MEQSADRLVPAPVTFHVAVFSGRSAGQAVCILTVEEEAIAADNSGPVHGTWDGGAWISASAHSRLVKETSSLVRHSRGSGNPVFSICSGPRIKSGVTGCI